MTGQLISSSFAVQVLDRFRERQSDVESLMRALVEIESPSGDVEGSREVVAALSAAAQSITGVDVIEPLTFPTSVNIWLSKPSNRTLPGRF